MNQFRDVLINLRTMLTFIDIDKIDNSNDNYITYLKNTGIVFSEKWYQNYHNFKFYIS